MTTQNWKGSMLAVPNAHIRMCGTPPGLVAGNRRYVGYFENAYGEQAVFRYDYETHKGTLWMGDIGWDHPQEVLHGTVPSLMLGVAEQAWLRLCWETATRYGTSPKKSDSEG